MKTKVGLAVFVSFVLVISSFWYRFNPQNKSINGFIALKDKTGLNTNNTTDNYDQVGGYDINSIDSSLTKTEQIGRGLISGYVDLLAQGNIEDKDLNSIANQYVNAIPTINKQPHIKIGDIKSIPSTKENLKQYADNLLAIEKDNSLKINAANDRGTGYINNDSDLTVLTKEIGNIYKETALKIKDLPTPVVLILPNLKLINLFLANSDAMLAISKVDIDSAAAFAGIISINNNLDKETAILNEMNNILKAYGI